MLLQHPGGELVKLCQHTRHVQTLDNTSGVGLLNLQHLHQLQLPSQHEIH
jgi:hypothetical protein